MGFSAVDSNDIFLDYDPQAELASDLFLDYDPEEFQKLQAAEIFTDNNPDALIEKTAKVKDIWDGNTPENRKARKQVIHDYMYAPEKTPEEISNMSIWEKMQYSKQLEREFEFRQSKGLTKGAASGATFGFSEYIEDLSPEEDDLLFGVGEIIGSSIPISGLYGFFGKRLVKMAAKSPIAKEGLKSLARMTGFGLTGGVYEGVKHVAKTGEAPSVEDVALHAASWAALDGALQLVGKGFSFANKLYKLNKNNKNLKSQEVVNDIINQLAKEKINPELNPEKYAERAEEILDSKLPKEEPVGGDQKTEEVAKILEPQPVENLQTPEIVKNAEPVEPIEPIKSSKIEAPAAKLEIEKPSQPKVEPKNKISKPKSKPQPVHVDILPEDLGKSSAEIVGQHVISGKSNNQFKLPSLKQTSDFLETKLYNQYVPLKLLGEGESSILNKPRELAELVKGSASTAEAVLKYGQYDLETGLINGPGFNEIFLPKRVKSLTGKKKLDRVAFDNYLAARSSLDRQAAGQKNPIPTAAAKEYIKQNPQFKEFAEDLTEFARNDVRNLRKAGLLSKEGEDAMFQAYQNYAPLYRAIPEELNLQEQLTRDLLGEQSKSAVGGNKSLKVEKPIKRATGSERKILSPTESFVRNTVATQKAIAKNQTMKAVGRQLQKYGYEVNEVAAPKRSQKELQNLMGENFKVSSEMVEDLNKAVDVINPETPKGSVRWYEDGKLFEVRGVPKDVVQAIDGLTPPQAGMVLKVIDKANRAFSAGVVLQPGTLMRLSLMDMFVASLQSKYPKFNGLLELPTRVMYEYPRMLFNILGKGNLYKDYMLSGAGHTTLRGIDKEMLYSMTDTLTNAAKNKDSLLISTLKAPLKPFKLALETLKKTSEVLGDVPRLLEYERSLEAGLKKGLSRPEAMKQAAFDAFEVTVPYGRKGSSSTLNTLYKVPLLGRFMNTIINSNVSFAKALDPRNPAAKGVYAAATAYLTIPTIQQYLKNRIDPRYQAIPQEDRDRNVYIYRTDDPDEEPIKMRKAWQFGWLFQTVPEHVIEYTLQKDPKALDGLLKSFESEFSPFSALSFSSAFKDGQFDPVKLMEGGRYSLIPEKQKRLQAELQATSSTTETAKILAKYAKISPIYIDFIVNQLGGGLGNDVLRLADEALYQTGQAVDRRPEKQAADSIFYGTFFARGPSKRNQYLNEFFEYVDKMDSIKANVDALYKLGRDKEADDLISKYINLNKERKNIGKYFKLIEEIRSLHPDDLDGVKKRKELNQIYRDMTDTAKTYVEVIKEISKEL
jgi:hypothetical protein